MREILSAMVRADKRKHQSDTAMAMFAQTMQCYDMYAGYPTVFTPTTLTGSHVGSSEQCTAVFLTNPDLADEVPVDADAHRAQVLEMNEASIENICRFIASRPLSTTWFWGMRPTLAYQSMRCIAALIRSAPTIEHLAIDGMIMARVVDDGITSMPRDFAALLRAQPRLVTLVNQTKAFPGKHTNIVLSPELCDVIATHPSLRTLSGVFVLLEAQADVDALARVFRNRTLRVFEFVLDGEDTSALDLTDLRTAITENHTLQCISPIRRYVCDAKTNRLFTLLDRIAKRNIDATDIDTTEL